VDGKLDGRPRGNGPERKKEDQEGWTTKRHEKKAGKKGKEGKEERRNRKAGKEREKEDKGTREAQVKSK
jgi:hypothetical protein